MSFSERSYNCKAATIVVFVASCVRSCRGCVHVAVSRVFSIILFVSRVHLWENSIRAAILDPVFSWFWTSICIASPYTFATMYPSNAAFIYRCIHAPVRGFFKVPAPGQYARITALVHRCARASLQPYSAAPALYSTNTSLNPYITTPVHCCTRT